MVKTSKKFDLYSKIIRYIRGDSSVEISDEELKQLNIVNLLEKLTFDLKLLVFLNECFNDKYVYSIDKRDLIEYIRYLVTRRNSVHD